MQFYIFFSSEIKHLDCCDMDFLFLAIFYALFCGLLFSCYLMKDSTFATRGSVGCLRTAITQVTK